MSLSSSIRKHKSSGIEPICSERGQWIFTIILFVGSIWGTWRYNIRSNERTLMSQSTWTKNICYSAINTYTVLSSIIIKQTVCSFPDIVGNSWRMPLTMLILYLLEVLELNVPNCLESWTLPNVLSSVVELSNGREKSKLSNCGIASLNSTESSSFCLGVVSSDSKCWKVLVGFGNWVTT